jgi:hypothetical protein
MSSKALNVTSCECGATAMFRTRMTEAIRDRAEAVVAGTTPDGTYWEAGGDCALCAFPGVRGRKLHHWSGHRYRWGTISSVVDGTLVLSLYLRICISLRIITKDRQLKVLAPGTITGAGNLW